MVRVSKKPQKQRQSRVTFLYCLSCYLIHISILYLNILYTGTSPTTWPRYLTIREIHFANSWKIEFCSARRTNLDKLFLRVAAIKLNLQDDEVQPTFYSIFLIILVIIALHWSTFHCRFLWWSSSYKDNRESKGWVSLRHDICPTLFTAGFSGRNFYTIHPQKLFSSSKNQSKFTSLRSLYHQIHWRAKISGAGIKSISENSLVRTSNKSCGTVPADIVISRPQAEFAKINISYWRIYSAPA